MRLGDELHRRRRTVEQAIGLIGADRKHRNRREQQRRHAGRRSSGPTTSDGRNGPGSPPPRRRRHAAYPSGRASGRRAFRRLRRRGARQARGARHRYRWPEPAGPREALRPRRGSSRPVPKRRPRARRNRRQRRRNARHGARRDGRRQAPSGNRRRRRRDAVATRGAARPARARRLRPHPGLQSTSSSIMARRSTTFSSVSCTAERVCWARRSDNSVFSRRSAISRVLRSSRSGSPNEIEPLGDLVDGALQAALGFGWRRLRAAARFLRIGARAIRAPRRRSAARTRRRAAPKASAATAPAWGPAAPRAIRPARRRAAPPAPREANRAGAKDGRNAK